MATAATHDHVHKDTVPQLMPPLLVDNIEAARQLSISTRTLWDMTQRGEVVAVRLGRRVLYDRRDLEDLVARRKSGGPAIAG